MPAKLLYCKNIFEIGYYIINKRANNKKNIKFNIYKI